jgi:inorganic triphosphatase YgiF
MATVVREIERKYDPAAGATAALDAVKAMTGTAGVAAVSQQGEQLLDAVYYDTADLRLIGAGITLRRRTGGEDAGWHLKLPAGADTRDEIRLPLAAASGAVPEELAALVRAHTRGTALAPVVRIQTSRRVLRLLDGASQALAEIAADHVAAEPADGPVSWDEIEAELVTGGPALLTAIDSRLRQAGALPAATATKLQRALAGRLPAAICERLVGTLRRELLDRVLILGEAHLRAVLTEYQVHYNTARPHRALNQAAPLRPLPESVTHPDHFRIRRRDRAGGVIHEFRLVA